MLHATDPAGYAGCCAAIRDMDLRPTASLIRAPTTAIAGERDPATPLDHAELLVRELPGATLATIDAAHLSNIEQPGRFAELVLGACLSRGKQTPGCIADRVESRAMGHECVSASPGCRFSGSSVPADAGGQFVHR